MKLSVPHNKLILVKIVTKDGLYIRIIAVYKNTR